MSNEKKTQEQLYDEQIRPLMRQIKDICKEHGIPWMASFQVAGDGTKMDVLTCIDGHLTEEGSGTRALCRAALALDRDEITSQTLLELLAMNAVLHGLFEGESASPGEKGMET